MLSQVIRFTIFGTGLGLLAGFAYGYWAGGLDAARVQGPIWILYGLLIGLIFGITFALFVSTRPIFDYQRRVTYDLAPCAWCHGSGRNFLVLRCRVCGGYGSVLAIKPRRKCAWCRGTGREFFFRCRVCGGAGWAYGHADDR
jgi:hypothetical protein